MIRLTHLTVCSAALMCTGAIATAADSYGWSSSPMYGSPCATCNYDRDPYDSSACAGSGCCSAPESVFQPRPPIGYRPRGDSTGGYAAFQHHHRSDWDGTSRDRFRATPNSAFPNDLPEPIRSPVPGRRLAPVERRVPVASGPVAEICPVTGAKLGSMGPPVRITVAGRDVRLCCASCEAKLRQNPEAYLTPMPRETTSTNPFGLDVGQSAPPANLSPSPQRATAADRAAILRQGTCPVMGDRLDPQNEVWKVFVAGQSVYVCCRSCIRDLTERPENYLVSRER